MAHKHCIAGAQTVILPWWHYMGGQTLDLDGVNSSAAAVPSEATIFEIRAEGGPVWFAINAPFASQTAPGYIPEDNAEIVGPLGNLSTLQVWSNDATAYAHIMYFCER